MNEEQIKKLSDNLVTHETYTAQHAKRILQIKDGQIVSDQVVEKRLVADGEGRLLK